MIVQIKPWIDESELTELKRIIESTYVTESKLTSEFEEMIKEYTGSKHAIAYTNGTLALYASLLALGIGTGDEVIVPDLTFIATSNAVIMTGAKPVFCDVDKVTMGIDITLARKLVNRQTKAIMPVELYGSCVDLDEIQAFAKEYNLKIIEDAAQGIGVKYNQRHVGTFGELGILSFYGNKTITCGEGGIILTQDDNLAKICYRLKNHGREQKGIFKHETIGFNFSFTEMQAAIGISQMKKLDKIINKKKNIFDTYFENLKHLPQVKPVIPPSFCTPVYWFTSFLFDDIEALIESLWNNGIQTRRFFYPLHMQPCYKDLVSDDLILKNDGFVGSRTLYDNGLSLPSSFDLSEEDQMMVIDKIKSFYENRN